MTENELMELINENVLESFRLNKETVVKMLTEIGKKYYPSTMEGLADLQGELLNYTMVISSIVCVAVGRILQDAGILNVRSEDK